MKTSHRRPTLKATLHFISAASLLTTAASAPGQVPERTSPHEILGKSFTAFLADLRSETDHDRREALARKAIASLEKLRSPMVEDSTVHFLYHGKAKHVTIPSDLNGWNPSADSMKQVPGTGLFYLTSHPGGASRFEYKLVVDSVWMTDPLNKRLAIGGYGPNSEIWMPGYVPPEEIVPRQGIQHGILDTIWFKSALLGRTHPVYIYLPASYQPRGVPYPSIWVTDGGEYLTLGLMLNVLDNLIADGRISPVVAVFVDPRTDPRDAGTSTRMYDYTMKDTLVNALADELRSRLIKKYNLSMRASETAVMGASLGGLTATFAGFQRPEVFGVVAAQSPSYWWADEAILALVQKKEKTDIRIYIDTGTIRDAKDESRKMKAILESKGYEIAYAEYPEGHNWVNWRSRLDEILVFFQGRETDRNASPHGR
jgi:enterochelin esterase family protein